jgi:hypothetical protein
MREALMSVAAEMTYTTEGMPTMPDRTNYELVDGDFLERHVSRLTSCGGGRIVFELTRYLEDHPIGLIR